VTVSKVVCAHRLGEVDFKPRCQNHTGMRSAETWILHVPLARFWRHIICYRRAKHLEQLASVA